MNSTKEQRMAFQDAWRALRRGIDAARNDDERHAATEEACLDLLAAFESAGPDNGPATLADFLTFAPNPDDVVQSEWARLLATAQKATDSYWLRPRWYPHDAIRDIVDNLVADRRDGLWTFARDGFSV